MCSCIVAASHDGTAALRLITPHRANTIRPRHARARVGTALQSPGFVCRLHQLPLDCSFTQSVCARLVTMATSLARRAVIPLPCRFRKKIESSVRAVVCCKEQVRPDSGACRANEVICILFILCLSNQYSPGDVPLVVVSPPLVCTRPRSVQPERNFCLTDPVPWAGV